MDGLKWDFGSGEWLKKIYFFKHHAFENIEPGKGGHFQKNICLLVFEKWGPGIFPKSHFFKISSSSHSKNAHIKLNGFQSIFGGWGDMPFFFLWAGMAKSPKMDPSRAVYPPGWGNSICQIRARRPCKLQASCKQQSGCLQGPSGKTGA